MSYKVEDLCLESKSHAQGITRIEYLLNGENIKEIRIHFANEDYIMIQSEDTESGLRVILSKKVNK